MTDKKPWYRREFALYKGETLLGIGTIDELHEETGKSKDFLRFMTFPTYNHRCKNGKNRLKMIDLDEEENHE